MFHQREPVVSLVKIFQNGTRKILKIHILLNKEIRLRQVQHIKGDSIMYRYITVQYI